MSVGANIKHYRLAQNMTQEKLAQAVGIGQSMICQIERGTKCVSLELGAELAKIFHCTIDDLVQGKPS